MSTSATYGRIYESITTGTSGGSYVVPVGKFAILEVEAVHSGFSTASASITVGGVTHGFTDVDGVRGSCSAFGTAGQTLTWSMSGTSAKYRLIVFNAVTTP